MTKSRQELNINVTFNYIENKEQLDNIKKVFNNHFYVIHGRSMNPISWMPEIAIELVNKDSLFVEARYLISLEINKDSNFDDMLKEYNLIFKKD